MDAEQLVKDQRGVAKGAGAAAVFSAIIFGAAWVSADAVMAPLGDETDRLVLVVRLDLAIALVLVVLIGRIANLRFGSATDIGGSANAEEGTAVRHARAVLQNSIEQALIALIAHAGLALALPSDRPAVLPALLILFVIGRLCFAAGFSRGAAARAFGFGLTFYPSAAAILVAAILAVVDAWSGG
jgi:hypothetical protein